MAVAYRTAQLNSYRTNSVLGLSPAQLVLKAYDMAVVALMARDAEKVSKVLVRLIDSLDFSYPDVSMGLFRLYRYCMEQVKKGEFEVPTKIMRELRDSWAQALAGSVHSFK